MADLEVIFLWGGGGAKSDLCRAHDREGGALALFHPPKRSHFFNDLFFVRLGWRIANFFSQIMPKRYCYFCLSLFSFKFIKLVTIFGGGGHRPHRSSTLDPQLASQNNAVSRMPSVRRLSPTEVQMVYG